MKKQLLTGAFVLASFFAAQAQVSYSFETSEGFTVGAIQAEAPPAAGQQGWLANSPLIVVDNATASDGTNSLLLGSNNTVIDGSVGAFSPDFTVSGDVEFSFDFRTSSFGEDASEFVLSAQGATQISSRIVIFNDGTAGVVKLGEDGQIGAYYFGTVVGEEFVPSQLTANTWYSVKVLHKYSEEIIEFYLNDELVQAANVDFGNAVTNLAFTTNNLGSTISIDDIAVKTIGIVGLDKNSLSSLTVSPNPTDDVVTIVNNENILVDGVTVIDLNGRTVKTMKFAGVSEAQVNLSDLSSGVYMVTISSDKGTTTKKIVKN